MKPYDAVEQAYKRGYENGVKDAKEAVERAYCDGRASVTFIDAVRMLIDFCKKRNSCCNCIMRDNCFEMPCSWTLPDDDAETEEKSDGKDKEGL